MERMNWPRHTNCAFAEFENRGHKNTLFLTDIYRNKFEGKNTTDDLSSPF